MKKFVLLLILNGLFMYCKAQDIEAFKKDPDIVIYKNVTGKLKANTLSHYYKMPSNFAVLQEEIRKNPTPDNMKMLLKESGMVHADEFVNDITLQRNSMLKFYQKHPEFKTMDPTKRNEVLKKVLID